MSNSGLSHRLQEVIVEAVFVARAYRARSAACGQRNLRPHPLCTRLMRLK